MKREKLYHRSVDILVQAYFNDTLIPIECSRCAVGNLISGNLGAKGILTQSLYKLTSLEIVAVPWLCYTGCITTAINNDYRILNVNTITGYSDEELELIEDSFMKYEELGNKSGDYFESLMKVVETLDLIHENQDERTTQESKLKFVKEVDISS